jgi:RNA 2',3'-cyclic 3'-phosphodiesterase
MDLRCFIAIEIPDAVKREIAEVADILKKYDADIKWVNVENLHVTLKFLGSTPEESVPEIRESLFKAVSSFQPFYIKIKGTGVFPNRKFPRVIWVGVENRETLPKLAADIDVSVSLLGYKKEEREFKPHLTLGRVRSRKGTASVVNELDNFRDQAFGSFIVDRIRLMRSELKPKGPEYSCLYEAPFGETGQA